MMENKKGSNVGFAIAFVLFISFVVFLLNILGPVAKVETDKDFLLKHLENEIIKEVSGDLTMTSVKKGNQFTKIYEEEIISNYEPQEGDKIGLIRTDEYVFESKIENLKLNYDADYDSLKTSFNIPEINDFYFTFIEREGITEIKPVEKEIPSTDVFAELIPVTYFDQNSEINIGYLMVVLW